jgi:hypothetical protein
MLTPQGWTKHAPGTYSIDLSIQPSKSYPDRVEPRNRGDKQRPDQSKRTSERESK